MKPIYEQNIIYCLKENETLDSVCAMFKVNLNHIKQINNISNAEFGDYIFLDNINLKIHTVKPNQTIEDIAKLYSTTVEHIKQINNISTIFLGQQLII